MAGVASSRRRKPIGEWSRRELWACATSFPLGALVVWVTTMSGGHFHGDLDRGLMGALLAFLLALLMAPAVLRFSIPAGRELWRRWRERPGAEPGAAADRGLGSE